MRVVFGTRGARLSYSESFWALVAAVLLLAPRGGRWGSGSRLRSRRRRGARRSWRPYSVARFATTITVWSAACEFLFCIVDELHSDFILIGSAFYSCRAAFVRFGEGMNVKIVSIVPPEFSVPNSGKGLGICGTTPCNSRLDFSEL